MKTEEESSFKPAKGISPINDQPKLENIDSTHSALQLKVKQCKKYSCRVCDFGTKKKRKYVDHIELHQKEGHLFCSLCNFASLNGKLFKKHLRAHKNDLRETETDNSIVNNGNISEVQLTSQCKTSFDLSVPLLSSNSLFLRPRSDSEEVVAEDSAADQLSEDDNKLLKRKENENLDGKKSFSCAVCKFKTHYKQSLTRHVKIHTGDRPFSCTFSGCNYSSHRNPDLGLHFLARHSKEKPYVCMLCGETFKGKHRLNSHVLNHTGKKPYCCLYKGCEYSSTSSGCLKTHMLTHTGEKPHHCYFKGCGYSCTTISSLNVHIRTHTGERPYACDFKGCNYSASNKQNLENHILTHTGVKPFHCDFKDCEFSCSQSGHLKEHMLRHLTENPHTCPKCKFRSRTPLEIEKHLETHHKLPITSPSSGQFQPNAPIRESPAESVTNILRAQAQPSLSSQDNNEINSKTQDAATPSKKYLPHSVSPVKAKSWKKFSCPVCEFGTKKKRKYKDHVELHQKQGYLFCTLCDFTSVSSKRFKKHLRTHENGPCDNNNSEIQKNSCSKVPLTSQETLSDTSSSLLNFNFLPFRDEVPVVESTAAVQLPDYGSKLPSLKEKENPTEQKCYSCSVCDFKTQYKVNLTKHTRLHTGDRPFSCIYSQCNYSSAKKFNLMRHLVVRHSDEKPYSCKLCGEAFKTKYLLNSHVINHTGRRSHQCLFKNCEYSFTKASDLKRHIRSHTKEKPHHCDFEGCDFSCSSQFNLKAHFRTHTGDRPYHCTFKNCNFSAARSHNLKTHSFIHTKIKQFHCDFSDCEFTCAQSGYLKLHLMQHLTQNQHACPKCKFRSRTSLEIKQHLETFHKLQDASNSGLLRPKNNNERDSETLDEARPSKKYICAYCGFNSKSKKKYKSHLESHVERRKFLEARDAKLKKHKRSSKEEGNISLNRSQTKENSTALFVESKKSLALFSCNFCKKSFAKEMKLFNHLRYHTGQKMPGL